MRALLNLGLKEAKELVEKSPTTILKGAKKEDADKILKKLEELGCKISLKWNIVKYALTNITIK